MFVSIWSWHVVGARGASVLGAPWSRTNRVRSNAERTSWSKAFRRLQGFGGDDADVIHCCVRGPVAVGWAPWRFGARWHWVCVGLKVPWSVHVC